MANIAIFRINYKSDFILTLNSDAGWMTPFCIKFWTGAPAQAYYAGYDGTTYTHCAPVAGDPTKLEVQFDDHHLPIGDLKFQIGYHFTVADFPTSVEDEVINQESVIIEVDDAPAQVMLDLNGETAPEIQFSLPAYANEAQRIANEQQRIANEQTRVNQEAARVQAEAQRLQAEQGRVQAEEGRVTEFQQMMQQAGTAIEGAENVDAELDGYNLTITNRQGESNTVNTKGVSGGMLFPVMNFDPETGILSVVGLQQEVDRIRYDYATAELIISFPMYNN
jgi:hypothetical protein